MTTIEDVLKACQFVREAGTSSRVPVPIIALEKICRDALAWQSTPAYIREVAEAVRASK
jgi:hypothetical protein